MPLFRRKDGTFTSSNTGRRVATNPRKRRRKATYRRRRR